MRMVFFNNKYNYRYSVPNVNSYNNASNSFNLNNVINFSTKTVVFSTLKGDFMEWLCGLIDGEGSCLYKYNF